MLISYDEDGEHWNQLGCMYIIYLVLYCVTINMAWLISVGDNSYHNNIEVTTSIREDRIIDYYYHHRYVY
jgi:hypothetical protein